MTSPFSYVDAAAFIGSWPLTPGFSGSSPAILPGALLDKATLLGARRETSAGFTVSGRSFKIWIDAVGPITVTFIGTNPLTLDDVISQINTGVSGGYGQDVAYRDNGYLRLRSATAGETSYLKIDTDDASSPADVFYELGLFAGLESYGGQLATSPTVDPDRQSALPDQYAVSYGDDLTYQTINRPLAQLAINAGHAYGQFRRGMAKTDSKNVAVTSDEFQLSGEHVYCGKVTAGTPQDDTIVVLDTNGNEVLTEHAVDLNTSLALDFWYDPETQKQYVDATAATPFVAGDDSGDFYVVVTTGGSFGALEQMKILEVVSTSRVVVMNVVEADGTEVEVGTQATPVSITDGIRRRIDTDRLYATDFLDGPAGSSVINQAVEIVAATAISRVEWNNRIVCDTATFVTDAVKEGDHAVIATHDTDVPFSNNGTYRVSKVIDQKTLELMTTAHGPAVLNSLGSLGTVTIQTDTNFFSGPYVKLSYAPPSGTYQVVFKKYASLLSMVDDVDAFSASPTRFIQEDSSDIQRIVKSILGPSATTYSDPLYGDERNSLENLYFRLNQEHDDAGRHTTIQPDNVFIGMTSSDTVNDGNVIFKAGDVPLFGFRISNSNAYLDLDASWSGSETTPVLRIGRNARHVGIGAFGASGSPATLLHLREGVSTGVSPNGATVFSIESDAATNYLSFLTVDDGLAGFLFANDEHSNQDGALTYSHNTRALRFGTAGATRAQLDASGNFWPSAATQDLGLTSDRWRYIYASTLVDLAGTSPRLVLDALSGAPYIAFERASAEKWRITQNPNDLTFAFGGADKIIFEGTGSSGHIYPETNAQTLGKDANRWGTLFATAGVFGSSSYSADIPFRTRMVSGDNTDQAGGYSEVRLTASYGGEKVAFKGVVNDLRDAGTASDVRCFDALYGGGGAGGGGTLTAYSGYRSDFSMTYASSGTTIATFNQFFATGNVGADGAITTLYGFRYDQPTVSGTLVNQYGLRISTVSLATNNYGIWLNGAGDGASDYAIYSNDGRSYFAHTYEGAAGRNGMTTLLIPQVTGGANTFYGAFNVLRTEFSSTQTGTCGVWWARWEKSCAQDMNAGICYRSTLTDATAASGTLTTFYGFFSEGFLDGFNVTSLRHYYAKDATKIGGSETLGSQYGLYVESLTESDANYGIRLIGVGEGDNDYAFRSDDGRTRCVHTYGGASSRSAFYWEYVVNTAGGAVSQQGTLHRMRSELSADATGTWTNMYVQSLKSEAVRDIAKWVGVHSRLQDDGTVSGEVTEWEGFLSSVRANLYDVPTLKHYVAEDASALFSGSITTQYGFYCQAMAEATNNYGLYIENATTAAIYVANGNTTLQSQVLIGTSEDQEERCIAVTCRNNSAVNAIPAGGIVVNPSAYSGSEIPVQVTASSANDQIFGIALETIAASGTGRVAIAGIVEVLVDTNGAAAGFHVVTSGAAASGAAGGTSSPTTGTVLGRYLNTVSGAAGAKAWALIGTNSG